MGPIQNRHIQVMVELRIYTGADPGFQVRGGAHKKIAPSGGRREKFWGIPCEKSRFYATKSYFSNFRGGARNFWGISCEKSRFYAKKIIFFPILGGGGGGGGAGCAPLNPPLIYACFLTLVELMLMFPRRNSSVLFAFVVILFIWLSHLRSDCIVTPSYIALSACSSWCPCMVYVYITGVVFV